MSTHHRQTSRPSPPHPPPDVSVIIIVLDFHTKNSDGVGGALNIFLFPNLSPSEELEAALLTRKWEAILGGVTLTSFVETSILMGNQKVSPIAGWY